MACQSCGTATPSNVCSDCVKTIHPFPEAIPPHDIGLDDSFCFVVPQATTNIVENPLTFPDRYTAAINNGGIFPLAPPGTTRDWVTNSGSPVSSFAIRVQPGVGSGLEVSTRLTPRPMGAAGRRYAASGYIKLPKGATVEVLITDAATNQLHVYSQIVRGTGQWQRVEATYNEFENRDRTFIIRSAAPSPPIDVWYASGFQIEELAPGAPQKPTTFTAGFNLFDWPGLREGLPGLTNVPERWTGVPHASTSERHRLTYSGGTCLSIKDCGFMVEGISGFNMPSPNVVKQPYALLDSSHYQNSFYQDSVSSIVLRQINCDPRMNDLMCARACLTKMVGHIDRNCRDLQSLRYTPRDECGEPCGEELEIVGSYVGGLEGLIDNCGIAQSFVLQFERQPFVRGSVKRTEGALGPTGNVLNGTQLAPNSVGPALYQAAYCYQGTAPTAPIWVFYAERFNWGGFNVRNLDTGSVITFTGGPAAGAVGPNLITTQEYVIISTEPTRSYAIRYNPATQAVNDITQFLLPGSDLNSFQLIRGYNNIFYQWPAADGITNPANNGQNINVLTGNRPNSLTFAYREMFFGISDACCTKPPCDPTEIQPGSIDITGAGDIVPYTQGP